MTILCAWCSAHLSGPPPGECRPVSHGICEPCRHLHFPGMDPGVPKGNGDGLTGVGQGLPRPDPWEVEEQVEAGQ